ncbi:MAG: hypothetical protein EPO21_14025 [Chloroflexota bacterium]|nr:MAG: hypothetical protein EPO21_14025 [Chloroflexota bacterium]
MEAYRHLGLPGKTEHGPHQPRSIMLRIAGHVLFFLARATYLTLLTLLDWSDRLIYLALLIAVPTVIARVFLQVLGLESIRAVSERLFAFTAPLVSPFATALPPITVGTHELELAGIAAMVLYPIGAWALICVLNLFKRLPW